MKKERKPNGSQIVGNTTSSGNGIIFSGVVRAVLATPVSNHSDVVALLTSAYPI